MPECKRQFPVVKRSGEVSEQRSAGALATPGGSGSLRPIAPAPKLGQKQVLRFSGRKRETNQIFLRREIC